jgi:hypothetical protein
MAGFVAKAPDGIMAQITILEAFTGAEKPTAC